MSTAVASHNFELPEAIGDTGRVWIYQCTRTLSQMEIDSISEDCREFTAKWAAHGNQLIADYGIYFDRFVCLFVDESGHDASGCSIDSSVHFVQALERKYKLSLFVRTEVAYFNAEGEVDTIHMNDISHGQKLGRLDKDTLVFNNLVATKGEMTKQWIIPIADSWQGRFLD